MIKSLKIAKENDSYCRESRGITVGEMCILRLRLRLLKNFNALTKYKVNVQKDRKRLTLSDSIILKSILFDKRFIDRGFVWGDTYEGHEFWRQINTISRFL